MDLANIAPGMTVADIGAGQGYYTVRLADRVGVMYRGRLVEMGPTEQVIDHPSHDYTRALISAVPRPDPRRRSIHTRHRYVEPAS